MRPPVVIGGVGGSGTRVVATILRATGHHIGVDVNESLDDLTHVLLFTRRDIADVSAPAFERLARAYLAFRAGAPVEQARDAIYRDAVATCDLGDLTWRMERARTALRRRPRPGTVERPWGWKVPDAHITLDRWRAIVPDLRYVHVVRNGLDMAFSANQQQLRRFGDRMIDSAPTDTGPARALRYWCTVQRRASARARAMGAHAYHFVNYDRLCAQPLPELAALLRFLGVRRAWRHLDDLAATIRRPASIGRFRGYDRRQFAPDDVAYVARLGFEVE